MSSLTSHGAPLHIVITGASSGIGAALAKLYSAPGRKLSLIARNLPRLNSVADACRARGADADVYPADVTDSAAIERILITCDAQEPVALVIANAGLGGSASLAQPCGEPSSIERLIFSTNAMGVINTITPLVPRFVARRRGQIAIISSLAGLLPLPDCPAYSSSKAATYIYGRALSGLLAPSGISVSVVCAGFVDTPMSASLPFRSPFLWTSERAARYVARALASGRREVSFPWQLAVFVRALGFLPTGVVDRMLMLSRQKGVRL